MKWRKIVKNLPYIILAVTIFIFVQSQCPLDGETGSTYLPDETAQYTQFFMGVNTQATLSFGTSTVTIAYYGNGVYTANGVQSTATVQATKIVAGVEVYLTEDNQFVVNYDTMKWK